MTVGGGAGRHKLGPKPPTQMAVLGDAEGDDDFDPEDEPSKQPAAAKKAAAKPKAAAKEKATPKEKVPPKPKAVAKEKAPPKKRKVLSDSEDDDDVFETPRAAAKFKRAAPQRATAAKKN